MLVLRDIGKEYTERIKSLALRSVNLVVDRDEFLAVVGPSGSGKTTLMNIMGLLDHPTSGQYWLDGQEVTRWSDRRLAHIRNRSIGFVHQSFNLIPTLSARENVELPLVYRQIAPQKRRRAAEQWLERLGLSDRMAHRPGELSGGQQQRVAMARALIGNPKVLLADEPTGNLDDPSAAEIMKILEELCYRGQTVILITHNSRFAKAADRIVALREGTLQSGEAESFAN